MALLRAPGYGAFRISRFLAYLLSRALLSAMGICFLVDMIVAARAYHHAMGHI